MNISYSLFQDKTIQTISEFKRSRYIFIKTSEDKTKQTLVSTNALKYLYLRFTDLFRKHGQINPVLVHRLSKLPSLTINISENEKTPLDKWPSSISIYLSHLNNKILTAKALSLYEANYLLAQGNNNSIELLKTLNIYTEKFLKEDRKDIEVLINTIAIAWSKWNRNLKVTATDVKPLSDRSIIIGKSIKGNMVLCEKIKALGSGSCGTAYKVRDMASGESMVIKTAHDQHDTNTETECDTLSQVNPQGKSIGLQKPIDKLVLPDEKSGSSGHFYPLGDLRMHLSSRQANGKSLNERAPLKELLFEATQLLSGLVEIHKRNIFHSDLIKENILCEQIPGSESVRLVLADFGYARQSSSLRDSATDIYQLGSILRDMFSCIKDGQILWVSNTPDEIINLITSMQDNDYQKRPSANQAYQVFVRNMDSAHLQLFKSLGKAPEIQS